MAIFVFHKRRTFCEQSNRKEFPLPTISKISVQGMPRMHSTEQNFFSRADPFHRHGAEHWMKWINRDTGKTILLLTFHPALTTPLHTMYYVLTENSRSD